MTFLYLVFSFYYKYSKDHAYTLWKNAKTSCPMLFTKIVVTVHCIVYGAGTTRSSVPLLQYCLISWNKYLFLSSLKPSGLILLGRMPCCGKFEGSFSNMKDCLAEKLFSLKKTLDLSWFVLGKTEVMMFFNVWYFLKILSKK